MTWPAHTTMITGTSPAAHGVLGNRYLDKSRRRLLKAWELNREAHIYVPTIYDSAKKAGLRTAALLWPGSGGARNLDYNLPEVYLERTFRAFVPKSFQNELTRNGIPFDWFARLSKEEGLELDFLVRDAAVHVITEHRPELTLVHFVSLDTYSHRAGPRSLRARWALQVTDTLVGDLIAATQAAGIYENTTFVVASDHGFLPVKRCIDLNRYFARQGLLRNIANPAFGRARAAAVYNGHAAYVYLRDPDDSRARANVIKLIKRIPEVERVIEPEEYAALGLPTPEDNGGVGDLVVLARPDAFFGGNNRRPIENANYYKGMHGYLPDHPDMRAGFVMAGPPIVHNPDPMEIDLRDLAPTILSVLEIEPPGTMQGRVLKEAFLPANTPTE